MAKEPTTNFPEQSAQSAMQVQNWLREMMEQNLNRLEASWTDFSPPLLKQSQVLTSKHGNPRPDNLASPRDAL